MLLRITKVISSQLVRRIYQCYKPLLFGCGSFGLAVASDTRGPRFESSHRQKNYEQLITANCIEKKELNKKRPGMAFLKIALLFG